MDQSLHATLAAWANFYLITGTAAAALTGLQFVVQTLIAGDRERTLSSEDPEEGISAFGTPTVVHFTMALALSAVMCAPWPDYGALHLTVALLGAGALVYAAIVFRRTRRQKAYVPTAYDWFWHVVLPTLAYGSLMIAGVALSHRAGTAFFVVAGATLLLVCVGIHNAWDTVTYLTVSAIRATGERTAERKRLGAAGGERSDNAGMSG